MTIHALLPSPTTPNQNRKVALWSGGTCNCSLKTCGNCTRLGRFDTSVWVNTEIDAAGLIITYVCLECRSLTNINCAQHGLILKKENREVSLRSMSLTQEQLDMFLNTSSKNGPTEKTLMLPSSFEDGFLNSLSCLYVPESGTEQLNLSLERSTARHQKFLRHSVWMANTYH